MASVQSQVLTQMAKKKKELDDQKERILRKQQVDRSVILHLTFEKFCFHNLQVFIFWYLKL